MNGKRGIDLDDYILMRARQIITKECRLPTFRDFVGENGASSTSVIKYHVKTLVGEGKLVVDGKGRISLPRKASRQVIDGKNVIVWVFSEASSGTA